MPILEFRTTMSGSVLRYVLTASMRGGLVPRVNVLSRKESKNEGQLSAKTVSTCSMTCAQRTGSKMSQNFSIKVRWSVNHLEEYIWAQLRIRFYREKCLASPWIRNQQPCHF